MFCGARSGSEPSRFFCNWGWTGGAMVLDKLAEPGRRIMLHMKFKIHGCSGLRE